MSHIDSQIVRSLLKNSTLPSNLDEIILYYLQLLYDGQYKWYDLRDISVGTHTFALNMEVKFYESGVKKFSYVGDVDVLYTGEFKFKFIANGTHYEFTEGWLYNNNKEIWFNMESLSGAEILLRPRT